MGIYLIKIIGIFLFPIFAFLVAGYAIELVTNRSIAIKNLPDGMPKTLNMRPLGYDKTTFTNFYKALNEDGRKVEQLFLELDLIFPFLYGGALAASLLLVWIMLEKPFSPAWFLVPVAIILIADWTENLIHLGQIGKFINAGTTGLSSFWIGIASFATVLKIWTIIASYSQLAWLCGRLIMRVIKSE